MEDTKNSHALTVLINSINALIKELNKANYYIYDLENPAYHLSKIAYDSDEDNLYFGTDTHRYHW